MPRPCCSSALAANTPPKPPPITSTFFFAMGLVSMSMASLKLLRRIPTPMLHCVKSRVCSSFGKFGAMECGRARGEPIMR